MKRAPPKRERDPGQGVALVFRTISKKPAEDNKPTRRRPGRHPDPETIKTAIDLFAPPRGSR